MIIKYRQHAKRILVPVLLTHWCSTFLIGLVFSRIRLLKHPVIVSLVPICSCPTKLNGFTEKQEPYTIMNHHGKRDATPHTEWKLGQEVTVADIVSVADGTYGNLEVSPTGEKKQKMGMLISTGQVVDNVSVPPAGGCVVSVMVELDGVSSLLDYPGFHQLFFLMEIIKRN